MKSAVFFNIFTEYFKICLLLYWFRIAATWFLKIIKPFWMNGDAENKTNETKKTNRNSQQLWFQMKTVCRRLSNFTLKTVDIDIIVILMLENRTKLNSKMPGSNTKDCHRLTKELREYLEEAEYEIKENLRKLLVEKSSHHTFNMNDFNKSSTFQAIQAWTTMPPATTTTPNQLNFDQKYC